MTSLPNDIQADIIERNRITRNIFTFRRKWLERLTFCSNFYENRWIGFVDMAVFIFQNV